MAQQVEGFEFEEGQTPPTGWRYDWTNWEDGTIWKLRAGEDWPPGIDAEGMRDRVHVRAMRRKRYAQTQKGFDELGEFLIVRFYDRQEAEA
jgi:hypothetical protein